MSKEVDMQVETAFIAAKPKTSDWSYAFEGTKNVCSLEIGGQIGYLARGRANKVQWRRVLPWIDVKNQASPADDNKWGDTAITGVEKATYYLKYGVLPEQRRLPNQVTIEELSAKIENQ